MRMWNKGHSSSPKFLRWKLKITPESPPLGKKQITNLATIIFKFQMFNLGEQLLFPQSKQCKHFFSWEITENWPTISMNSLDPPFNLKLFITPFQKDGIYFYTRDLIHPPLNSPTLLPLLGGLGGFLCPTRSTRSITRSTRSITQRPWFFLVKNP